MMASKTTNNTTGAIISSQIRNFYAKVLSITRNTGLLPAVKTCHFSTVFRYLNMSKPNSNKQE